MQFPVLQAEYFSLQREKSCVICLLLKMVLKIEHLILDMFRPLQKLVSLLLHNLLFFCIFFQGKKKALSVPDFLSVMGRWKGLEEYS